LNRRHQIGIVKRSGPDENQMWPCFCLAEQWRTAFGAESALHPVAAVGNASVPLNLATHFHALGMKANTHHAIAAREVLA
jgi:hypothetical protein